MSALTEYVHIAIAETHPNAFASHAYMFSLDENGEPYMSAWDEARLGPLDLAAIAARCEEIATTIAIPKSVTRAQALMALYNAGLLPQVQSAVDAHTYPPVKIWFDNALNFERNHTYLQAIAIELGLTGQQVDELFIAAAALTA